MFIILYAFVMGFGLGGLVIMVFVATWLAKEIKASKKAKNKYPKPALPVKNYNHLLNNN